MAHKPIVSVFRSQRARKLTVVAKINGGKAVAPFMRDPRVVAAGGTVRVLNGCTVALGQVQRAHVPRNLLARLQSIEYLRAFLMARVALGHAGLLTIVSGAFGVFDRAAVAAVGGYSADIVGEDLELVVKLHRMLAESKRPYRVVFVPHAVC